MTEILLAVLVVLLMVALLGLWRQMRRRTAKLQQQLRTTQKYLADNIAYLRVLNEWMNSKYNGRELADALLREGYRKVAVYGMGTLGLTLCRELLRTEVEVVYAIDRHPENIYSYVDIYTLDESPQDADLMIVTPFRAFGQIRKSIENRQTMPIISLADLVSRCKSGKSLFER